MLDSIVAKDKTVQNDEVSENTDDSGKIQPSDDKKVFCRKCHGTVADIQDRIRINNSDYHLFSNPLGIYFRVLCFSRADGVFTITEYVEEHTWFSGYSWSIALCRNCNAHLGWHYKSGDSVFYGLIADRLAGV